MLRNVPEIKSPLKMIYSLVIAVLGESCRSYFMLIPKHRDRIAMRSLLIQLEIRIEHLDCADYHDFCTCVQNFYVISYKRRIAMRLY